MPAKGEFIPGSRRDRVYRWYQEHPGFHRCQDVAAALGEPTQPIAVASRNLMLVGYLQRRHADDPAKPNTKPQVLYGINPNGRT